MSRLISRAGVEILHGRISELEKQVAELQESFAAMRQALEMIRDAVTERGPNDKT